MKKLLKVLLIIGLLIVISLLILFFISWSSWKKNSDFYLKQTEIYYNSLTKFSSNSKYKYIQNSNDNIYTIYPIKVLDRNNKTIGFIKTNNKIIVPLNKISQNFINALISTEDQNFYIHNGISFFGIIRAFLSNISSMRLAEGGSTITQQLSKLLFSKQERTFKRKINEFFIALSIEKNYTKNDILFMYSNLIYFGYNIYGVGLASRAYFGKDISTLSVPEAALLVTLISNPSFYNPYRHIENTKRKHLAVLINMYQKGFLTKESVVEYYNNFWKNPTLLPSISLPENSFSGNKGLYVLEEVRRDLNKRYGSNYLDELQGTTVHTTIDINVQDYIDNNIPILMTSIKNESSLRGKEKDEIQSATVISKVDTGEILGFSGGNNFSIKNQFNRSFQARRQVGSTIKPFLYAVGLNLQQITPYTVFEDVPIEIEFKNKLTWDVNNYAKSYRGYLNVADALKRSSNVVAVQAADKIGLENLQQFFQQALKIDKYNINNMFSDYQYSVALGAVNLTPLQLNQLYQILANNGQREDLYFISEIEDISGNVLYKHKRDTATIFSKEASYLIQKILTTVLSPGGSGYYVKRNFPFTSEVAGKSGTTQNNRDVWFAGFTSSINITTWIGQDNNKSLGSNFLGGIQSGRLFGTFMKYTENLYPSKPFHFNRDYNFVKSDVDLLTGFLPSSNSLFKENGLFIRGTEPKKDIYLNTNEQLKIALQKRIITSEEVKKIKNKNEEKQEVIIEEQTDRKTLQSENTVETEKLESLQNTQDQE